MTAIGLTAEVSGRVKHYYSFYKKLQRSTGELEQMEDLASALDMSQIYDSIALPHSG